ncbi:MAG: hypothetical protein J6W70_03480, partial [Lentisphaeria bacterium]|nr:hypothetical protein [Lentisphaeria bacterium]
MATDVAVTDGKVFVSSGGVVSGITIGATYYDVTQRTGSGYYSSSYEYGQTWITNPGIHLSSGGKLTGQMTFNSGAKVFAANGSIIDFDLTQAAAGGSALLTDITLVEGAPNYSLTIDGTQENGTYRLAGGFGLGSVFSGMISVLNTSGNQLGILMVGQTFAYNDTEYSLGVADGCLSVTVQGAEVTPGDVDAPTAPTGLDAVVSGQKVALVWNAATDESSGVKEYVVTYTLNGQVFTARTSNTNYVLTGADFGSYSWSVQTVDFAGNESAVAAGEGFSVSATPVSPDPGPGNASAAKGDIDGNGVSDVMFQWTGGDNQIGFWMNGHTQWQSQSRTHSPEWTVLGARDMNADGKADTLMLGQASIIDMQGTYIGYYSGGVDTDANWHTIGFLLNQGPSNNAAWNNAVGNLTGSANANSIVWYSPNLYALGIWTDGTDNWKSLSYDFGGDAWTLVGCGDFDGDGKDSVVMSYNGGQLFYAVGIDGASQSLGSANWSGW